MIETLKNHTEKIEKDTEQYYVSLLKNMSDHREFLLKVNESMVCLYNRQFL